MIITDEQEDALDGLRHAINYADETGLLNELRYIEFGQMDTLVEEVDDLCRRVRKDRESSS